jgi:hypothetical protein
MTGVIGAAALTGRSAAKAELVKPAVIAIAARSFFMFALPDVSASSRRRQMPCLETPTSGRTIGEGGSESCDRWDTSDKNLPFRSPISRRCEGDRTWERAATAAASDGKTATITVIPAHHPRRNVWMVSSGFSAA